MPQEIDAVSFLHIDRNQLFREGLRHILSDSPFAVLAGDVHLVRGAPPPAV